jgi:hypothetical protein
VRVLNKVTDDPNLRIMDLEIKAPQDDLELLQRFTTPLTGL